MADLIHRHSGGVFVIVATSFSENGALDLDSTDRASISTSASRA